MTTPNDPESKRPDSQQGDSDSSEKQPPMAGLWTDSLPPKAKNPVSPDSDSDAESESPAKGPAGLWTDSPQAKKKQQQGKGKQEEDSEDLFADSMPPQTAPEDAENDLWKASLPPQAKPPAGSDAQGEPQQMDRPSSLDMESPSTMEAKSPPGPHEKLDIPDFDEDDEGSEELFKESISPKANPSGMPAAIEADFAEEEAGFDEDDEASANLWKESLRPQAKSPSKPQAEFDEDSEDSQFLWKESISPSGPAKKPSQDIFDEDEALFDEDAEESKQLWKESISPGAAPSAGGADFDEDAEESRELWKESIAPGSMGPVPEAGAFEEDSEESKDLWKESISPSRQGQAEAPAEGAGFDEDSEESRELWKESIAPGSVGPVPAAGAFDEDSEDSRELWNESMPPSKSAPVPEAGAFDEDSEDSQGLWNESMAPSKPMRAEPEAGLDEDDEASRNLFNESMPPRPAAAPEPQSGYDEDSEESKQLWNESLPPGAVPVPGSSLDSEGSSELFDESRPPQPGSSASSEPEAGFDELSEDSQELWNQSISPEAAKQAKFAPSEPLDMSGLFEEAKSQEDSDQPAAKFAMGPASGIFRETLGGKSKDRKSVEDILRENRKRMEDEGLEEPSSLWNKSFPPVVGPSLADVGPAAKSSSQPGAPGAGEKPDDQAMAQKISGMWAGAIGPATHEKQSLSLDKRKAKKGSGSKVVVKIRSMDKPKNIKNPETETPDYEIQGKLGEGGMGIVYLARQTSIDRMIAVKMLKPDQASDPDIRERFLAEACATGDLDHPNIVPVHELGRTEKGGLFYSMKRVVGKPWADLLLHKDLTDNLDIWMRVADAVAFAHDKGIIHRDLKPENVMLGDYGEVLLMDWGLAASITGKGKGFRAEAGESMAGTPSYMPPETASGTSDQFKVTSDIYLLGAMLYEIVTGFPPHTGKTVVHCLMAAARNEIIKTDKKDELVDIALKAMATKVTDRYPNVREMQAAVRQYLSHRESVVLSNKADNHLQDAYDSKKYDDFAQAMFGYREALSLWHENQGARSGLAEATLAYAEAAFSKDDFDLALSLLDENKHDHRDLVDRIKAGQEERINRQKQLKFARRATIGLAAAIFVGLLGGFYWINAERQKAITAREEAVEQKELADQQKIAAEKAKKEAELQRQEAEAKRIEAEEAKEEADQQRKLAEEERRKADMRRKEADDARKDAETQRVAALAAKEDAEKAQKETSKQAYYAQIGLAAAQINFNSYGRSNQLLRDSDIDQRHWEWGYLDFLCNQQVQTYGGHTQPIEAVAVSPDGQVVATVGQDGNAFLFARASGEPIGEEPITMPNEAAALSAAYSPDGNLLAIGTDLGNLLLVDAKTREVVHNIEAHPGRPVHALAFSPTEPWVATASDDNQRAIRLWNTSTGERVGRRDINRGNEGLVRTLQFSQDGTKLLSVGEGGMALVWRIDRQEILNARIPKNPTILSVLPYVLARQQNQRPMVRAHAAEIFAAQFTPDGNQVLTAGESGEIKLWDLTSPDGFPKVVERLQGHSGRVNALALTPDGKYLLSAGNDNTAVVWDFEQKQLWKVLRGHGGWVSSVAWVPNPDNPDQLLALTGSYDTQAKLWDASAYREIIEMTTIRDVALEDGRFAPQGDLAITASSDGRVYVWDGSNGESLARLDEGHRGRVNDIAATADGTLALSAGEDGRVLLWDLKTGAQIAGTSFPNPIPCADISPDGSKFVIGSGDKLVLWGFDRDAKKLTKLWEQTGPKSPELVRFSPDGKRWLTSFGFNRSEQVWLCDAENPGKLLAFPKNTTDMHSATITGLEFLPNSNVAVTASLDTTVALWDLSSGNAIGGSPPGQNRAQIDCLAVSPDGTALLTGDENGVVRHWQVEKGSGRFNLRQQASFDRPGDTAVRTSSVSFAPDGSTAIATYLNTQAQFLNLAESKIINKVQMVYRSSPSQGMAKFLKTGQLMTAIGDDAFLWNLESGLQFSPEQEVFQLGRHFGGALAVVSPDGSKVITVGVQNHICKIWDWKQEQVISKFALQTPADHGFTSLDLSPDGQSLVTADNRGTAWVWNFAEQESRPTHVFEDDSKLGLRSATFSPDGQLVAVAGQSRVPLIWNFKTNKVVAKLEGHSQAVNSVAFAEDSRSLVTAGDDGFAILWQLDQDLDQAAEPVVVNPTTQIPGHTGSVVNTAVFSPDGRRVFTSSQDKTVKVWDSSNGRELITLRGHQGPVTSVRISSDQTKVLSTSADGTARIWPATRWMDKRPEKIAGENVALTD